MLHTVKTFLILMVGIWGLIGALGNLGDWNGVVGAVKATTSMSWQDGNWRAISNPIIVHIGAAMIPAAKLLFGGLCLVGAWQMWRTRLVGGLAYETAKLLALSGCGIALMMLFVGWIVIADTWFQAWRSEAMRSAALGTAFRYAGFVGLISLFVAARDDFDEA